MSWPTVSFWRVSPNYDDIGHKPYRPQTTSTSDNRPTHTARMPCEMRTDQNTNPRRLRPTDGLLKPTQATVLHCVRRLYGHTPATVLLRLQNTIPRIDHFRFFGIPDPCDAAAHWPPWFTKTSHALCGRFGVADVVCGRYRRFPFR